jgi:glutamine amidotransferase
MIAVIDYGMGNLRSVEKALQKLGHHAVVTDSPERIATAERVILPGVGAFGAAMANLSRPTAEGPSLAEAVRQAIGAGKPFLGICLGMQLLLSESEEMGRFEGLDVIPGRVRRFEWRDAEAARDLKIPHMGWNALTVEHEIPLLEGIPTGAMVYFVHSYYCAPDDPAWVAATADHGGPFCAVLGRGHVAATQFHPEKSGEVGLRMLDNFARLPVASAALAGRFSDGSARLGRCKGWQSHAPSAWIGEGFRRSARGWVRRPAPTPDHGGLARCSS